MQCASNSTDYKQPCKLIVLDFKDTSTLVGHFVSSIIKKGEKKKEEIVEEMKEREREERRTGMKVKKQKK